MSGVGAEKLNAAEELNATAPGEEVMEDESQRGSFDPLAAEQLIDILIDAPLPTPSTHKVALKNPSRQHNNTMAPAGPFSMNSTNGRAGACGSASSDRPYTLLRS